jgi:8-oxo-dGTP diphosphatase
VTSDRFRLPAAVYGVLVEEGRVLLMRRAGSGYRDGQWGLPAGHLDGDEDLVSALVRELREELAITVAAGDVRLGLVLHSRAEDEYDSEYLHLFFQVAKWDGTPVIAEPDKCTELVWAEPGHLPVGVIDYVVSALQALHHGRRLVLTGWPTVAGDDPV